MSVTSNFLSQFRPTSADRKKKLVFVLYFTLKFLGQRCHRVDGSTAALIDCSVLLTTEFSNQFFCWKGQAWLPPCKGGGLTPIGDLVYMCLWQFKYRPITWVKFTILKKVFWKSYPLTRPKFSFLDSPSIKPITRANLSETHETCLINRTFWRRE